MELITKNTITNKYELINENQYNALMSIKYTVDNKTDIPALSELIEKLNQNLNQFCPVEKTKSHEKYCIGVFHMDIRNNKNNIVIYPK